MDWKEFFRPTKGKIFLFIVFSATIIPFLFDYYYSGLNFADKYFAGSFFIYFLALIMSVPSILATWIGTHYILRFLLEILYIYFMSCLIIFVHIQIKKVGVKKFFKLLLLKIKLVSILAILSTPLSIFLVYGLFGDNILIKYFIPILGWPQFFFDYLGFGLLSGSFLSYALFIFTLWFIFYYIIVYLISYHFKRNKKVLFLIIILFFIIYSGIFFPMQAKKISAKEYHNRAIAEQDETFCEKIDIKERPFINACYSKLAIIKKDPILCDKTLDLYSKGTCYVHLAKFSKNVSICEMIDFEEQKATQYYKNLCITETKKWMGE